MKRTFTKYATIAALAGGGTFYATRPAAEVVPSRPATITQQIELETKSWVGDDGRTYTLTIVPREHLLEGETTTEAVARIRREQANAGAH